MENTPHCPCISEKLLKGPNGNNYFKGYWVNLKILSMCIAQECVTM